MSDELDDVIPAEIPSGSVSGDSPTAEQIQRLTILIQSGNDFHISAAAIGVRAEIFDEWMRKGKEGGQGRGPHMELYREVLKARATAEASLVSRIQAAATKSWTAAAWLLERGFDGWSKKSVLEHQDKADVRPEGDTVLNDLDNVTPLRRGNAK